MQSQTAFAHIQNLQDRIPQPLHGLAKLAVNCWWSWSSEQLSIFRDIDFEKWEQYQHNPVKLLKHIPSARLAQLAADPQYCKRVTDLVAQLEDYLVTKNTWASQNLPQNQLQKPIAYFSIEYGITRSLPTYSGGLGILAADHLKSASDLGLPFVAIGLLYRQGYFKQQLDASGWQQEIYPNYRFEELPIELYRDAQGEALTVTLQIRDRQVKAQIWQVQIGRINLYLLDTDREDNEQIDRWITGQLYGGGQDTRLAQEYLLGIGGVRALQLLDIEPQIYHLNEGHAAFATLEIARQLKQSTGKSFDEVRPLVRDRCVFTTHTPVPAGHDIFPRDQIAPYFTHYWQQLGLSKEAFLDLGNRHPGKDGWEPFNMTALALKMSRSANGVSQLNGEICRQMWSCLYPNVPVERVPIGHITNGVHHRSFTAPLLADLYKQYLHPDWADQVTDTQMWVKVDEIPDDELWWRHQRLQTALIAYTRSQVKQARERRGESTEAIAAAEQLLDPNILTIGFARRFSSYKRGDLITYDPDRARAIFSNPEQPVQMIVAGKAHPADEESKRIMQRLIEWSHHADIRNRLVFVEDYDMHIAQKLVQGVDVWLNTPRRPHEASGTSGQKVAFNGGINCSILDGWWCEAYQEGVNGWTIGDGADTDDTESQDRADAESLYKLLETEIIPCYYDRDSAGIPHRWVQMMKASIRTIAPYFNTDRMVADYVNQMYLPKHEVSKRAKVGMHQ
ncbi:alpha-glucan family phosphorylase [Gloeocapsa sp. BRSZ]